MPVINCGEPLRLTFTNAYTSVSGSTYTLTISIPPYSKYKFTEASEAFNRTASEVSKTYTNSGSGISGYILVNSGGEVTLSGKIS